MIHETNHLQTDLNKYINNARETTEMRKEEIKLKVK